MSSSRKARLELRSPSGAIEFSLMDASLQQVASGTGSLEARVDPGIYQLEVRAGPRVESNLLLLEAGDLHRDLGVTLKFPTATPLEGATASHEDQQRAAFEGSAQVAKETGPDSGLVVVVRNGRQAVVALGKATTNRLSLLDHNLRPVRGFARNWRIEAKEGWATWSGRLQPGGYVLRTKQNPSPTRQAGGVIDQSLWLNPRWQTLVFVPNTAHGPATENASIHMAPHDQEWLPGWNPDSQQSGAALELALWGLRQGRPVVPDDLLGLLLRSKFANAMLGIVGAHSLLLQPRVDFRRFNTVLRNLQRLVPEHPDVAALSWLGVEAKRGPTTKTKSAPFPPITVSWPPMLGASYMGLVRLDAQTRGGIVPGSVAEAIAANVVIQSVWTSWRPLARPAPEFHRQAPRRMGEHAARRSTKAPPKRAIKAARSAAKAPRAKSGRADPATDRVERYIEEVSRLQSGKTSEEALKTTGHDQISVATSLPVSSVRRALKELSES
jgi:hypothetical protein